MNNMIFSKEVKIYTDTSKEPVLEISRIELAKSKLFAQLMGSINICDGCNESICMIIAGEEGQTLVATFNELYAKKKKGVFIIEGSEPRINSLRKILASNFLFLYFVFSCDSNFRNW